MIIKSIVVTEEKWTKEYDFSSGANLLHSVNNTAGKTTLLRVLLYSLGYAIPSTKNIHFERCLTKTEVEKGNTTYIIKRENEYLLVISGNSERYYILPEELNAFHEDLFSTNNPDVLNNILGTFYLDQEKGWTLLNRGVAIGKNRFNIQQLILGLSKRDYTKLQTEFQLLEREIRKYQHMKNVSQYQQEVFEEKGDIIHETYDESQQRDLAVCSFDLKSLNSELHQVNAVISDNDAFCKYIERMGLCVIAPNGDEIPVNKNTVKGLPDNINFLLSRRRLLVTQISKLGGKMVQLRNQLYYNSQQPSAESLIQAFDRNISAISIDAKAVENILAELSDRYTEVKMALHELTRVDNPILQQMYTIVKKYTEELEIDNYMSSGSDFLFTSNLKELSGAVLMKMVFAFRLAYIAAVESTLDIKLPIILDSPSGKELDQNNIQKMITILDRDFSDHQIIIASIHTYALKGLKTIELNGYITR